MRVLLVLMVMFAAMLPGRSHAFHIIGGEMYYDCLGNNQYLITLKIYRDCSSQFAAPYDDPAYIAIYNASNVPVQTLQVPFPGSVDVEPDLSNPCLIAPPDVCVQQAIYEFTVTLPPSAGGYNIVYQRCCRNTTIVNVIGPSTAGATYTAHIPDPDDAACNNSPRFNNYPPIVVCVNESLVFDHSATDPDGDVLQYSFCTPNQGADALNPQPTLPPPPPYAPIFWAPPYSVSNQIGGTPTMAVDNVTGLLTAQPSSVGQFVVGVCVNEYRNGVLLSTNVRDFQINVTECDALIEADFSANSSNAAPNDTLLICGTLDVAFDNMSYGSVDFIWDFGVPGSSSDVSTDPNPTFTYPDTGVYLVQLIAAPGITCGDTSRKYVELRKGVDASFAWQPGCAGSLMPFTDLSIPLDGTLNTWFWEFGDGNTSTQQNPFHIYLDPLSYTVSLTVTNSYGCIDQFTASPVTVFPLAVVNAGPDTFVCDVDVVTLSADNGISYSWAPNYNISNTSIANPVVDPDVTTVYTVTVTDANGCVASDEVTIQVADTVIAEVSDDATICEGQSMQLNASNAVYYQWSPSAGLSADDVPNPLASPLVTTMYLVDSYIGSCVDRDTVTITVLPKPTAEAGSDTTINQGETIILNATGSGDYLWSPPDGLNDASLLNPVAGPLNTVTYTLTVTADNGCKAEDSVTINVTHIHLFLVPNAFTPNGDGLNDQFEFFTKGIMEITSVKIYSRWGQLMFAASDSETGWDGTYGGKECEIETYIYHLTGITYDGYVLEEKGALTLLR